MAAGSADSMLSTRFPIPLVGAAAILALLIILTPVLITGGGGAGSLLAQADLVVDHPPNSFNTSFYVRGVGVVRYAEILIGLNQDYVPGTPASLVHWTSWVNGSNMVSLHVTTDAPSVAVNVSAYYIPTHGSGVWYYGVLTSYYNDEQSTLALTALSGGLAVPSGAISTTGHTLPIAVALAYQSSSGAPA